MLGWKKSEKASGPQLRVLPAALEGYRFTFRNIGTALRLILVSTLCLSGVHFAVAGANPIENETRFALAAIAEVVAMVVLAAIVLVAWQRRILLGPGYAKMRFGRREGRMLLAVLMLGFLIVLAGALVVLPISAIMGTEGGAIADKLELLANLAMAYVTGRLFFVLPARAMDRKLSFREAWKMTAGHSKGLMFVALIVGIPVILLSNLTLDAYYTAMENAAVAMMAATHLLHSFLFMLEIVVTAAAMTFCYAALGGYEHILEARRAEAEAETEAEAAPA